MKKILKTLSLLLLTVALLHGCSSNNEKPATEGELPKTPPEEVVKLFYDLISEGGKITSREALSMVSDHYMMLDIDSFRKWTQDFTKDTKIEVLETVMPTKPNKDGLMVAVVKLNIKTPSIFGDFFTTKSNMNLILDKESNEWKIDFMADTIDEAAYLDAPAEARLPEPDEELEQ